MIRWLLALSLALAALPGVAQVYTYIDAQGNRVFTDQPRPGNAKKVQLPPGNRMPTPPPEHNLGAHARSPARAPVSLRNAPAVDTRAGRDDTQHRRQN